MGSSFSCKQKRYNHEMQKLLKAHVHSLFFRVIPLIMIWTPITRAANFDQSHRNFTKILQRFSKQNEYSSCVNNFELLNQDKQLLGQYLSELAAVSKREYNSWTENQKLAFLINAYNIARWMPLTAAQKMAVETNKVSISYLRYDWSLNICR